MEHGLHNKAAIIGMGCTKFGERYDASKEDMIVEAVTEAISDAGINFSDIDAFWYGTMVSDFGGTGFSAAMKSQYKPVTRVENMCCTGSDAFGMPVMLLRRARMMLLWRSVLRNLRIAGIRGSLILW